MSSIPHISGEMQLQLQPYTTFMKAKIENWKLFNKMG